VRYTKGFAHREWTKKAGARNEALDARNYAYAALQSLIAGGFRLNKQAQQFEMMLTEKAAGDDVQRQPASHAAHERAERQPWIERRDWFNRRSEP
jgi:phage terminase large subunit GpA-like protein